MTCEPCGHPGGFTVGDASPGHLSSFSNSALDESVSSESLRIIVEAPGGLFLDKPGNVDRPGFDKFLIWFVIVEPAIDELLPLVGTFAPGSLETGVDVGEDELCPGYQVSKLRAVDLPGRRLDDPDAPGIVLDVSKEFVECSIDHRGDIAVSVVAVEITERHVYRISIEDEIASPGVLSNEGRLA